MNVKRPHKTASLEHEQGLWAQGYRLVYGFDEAGRGAWAGPVVAAAVCLPPDDSELSVKLIGVHDSKQLTRIGRDYLFDRVQAGVLTWGVGSADQFEIDEFGIIPATKLAMRRALNVMAEKSPGFPPDHFLLDALKFDWNNVPYLSLIRGDQRSLTIAAASILAKVHRDRLMIAFDSQYPDYGFAAHKGYGTPQHQRALLEYGAAPIHRMSFAPLRATLL
jgi:ribonuclease HII